MNFTQKKNKAKKILNELNEGFVIEKCEKNFSFLYDFFQLHPNADDKFRNGCLGFTKIKQPNWGNHSFAIIDVNFNQTTISASFNINGNNKADNVLKAFRTAIHPIIRQKRNEFIENETLCEIDGNIIGSLDDLHIDHHNLNFKDVVSEFMKINGLKFNNIGFIKKGTVRHLTDTILAKKFIDFHNSNTTLRFTHKTNNLTKKK